jgi:hypothetical protein
MLFSTNRRTVRGARATRSKKRLTRREFTINLNASAIARGDAPRSFEEMLDAVKRKIAADTSVAENSQSQIPPEHETTGLPERGFGVPFHQ